ncbi:cation diffusion facilitator family transporter [Novosphingobium album (ex Hu et al. 2023)]|uniref:Cation diffusion facilitator family transporter n=1 Tax=Novosphingobium album (ex Hu et al. 2023) TaxID=2930093 RepID=A0ABT0B6I3_9SPHN|nr:cation diffusion facilitator family transporter [Novosphingobium album (ex Hu et al. 2023)]MCJ2180468.1 cation diffusion facilitator family transporter [Novosphingobium album (ex Hu et al. 2023)]
MADCGCGPTAVETKAQQRTLLIALWLNGAMFLVETTAGLMAGSTGLTADGLDMLTDATAYAIALAAIGRSSHFKANAATLSGTLLLLVGLGLLADVTRRMLWGGEPEGGWMIAVAGLALAVNVYVLRLLGKQRRDEVHLKAAWIFTRADVIANAAVIAAGAAVLLTGWRYFDLGVGAAIGLYVVREALEILGEARVSRAA